MNAKTGEVLATLGVSSARLALGTVGQAALGALLIAVAVTAPTPGIGWRLLLLGLGAFAVWNAWELWKAGRRRLILTRESLSDDEGRQLCAIADVASVSRSVFAMKPARGFALTLRSPAPRAWVPGLWWRVGRRLGVGGVTSAIETRLMAETIEALLARRAADDR